MLLGVNELNAQTYCAGCPAGPSSFGPGSVTNQCDALHFWSLHGAGGNFAFVDGSVHFISYAVAAEVMSALATRAGGERGVSPE